MYTTQLNLDIIEALMPDLGGAVLNAFSVHKGRSAYGAHNARPWMAGFRQFCLNAEPVGIPHLNQDLTQSQNQNPTPSPTHPPSKCNFPHQQNSLHAALEDVSYDHQPLVIFEDAEPEVPSTLYMNSRLDEALTDPQDRKALYAARASSEYPDATTEMNVMTGTQFSFAKYLEIKYCSRPWRTKGVWWALKAGQALFFNNYMPHGDSTLPKDDRRSRYSVDLR